MKGIQQLLQRYVRINAPEGAIKEAFITAVDECIKISLSKKDIKINKKTVYLQVPAVIKNEIRFNQQSILKKTANLLGNTNALTAIL